ncbi:MAG: DUF5989 family protein [Pirellulaceae bacterium]
MNQSDEPVPPTNKNHNSGDFERLSQDADPGIVREFIDFLQNNKKWWLAPILLITLLLVGLAFLSASPAAPFIYSLF